jgi:hypothetical protein
MTPDSITGMATRKIRNILCWEYAAKGTTQGTKPLPCYYNTIEVIQGGSDLTGTICV